MIRTKIEGPVVELVIDRPERRNAFDNALCRALGDAIASAEGDPEWRVLVNKGASDVFSTGRELKAAAEMSERDPEARAAETWPLGHALDNALDMGRMFTLLIGAGGGLAAAGRRLPARSRAIAYEEPRRPAFSPYLRGEGLGPDLIRAGRRPPAREGAQSAMRGSPSEGLRLALPLTRPAGTLSPQCGERAACRFHRR